MSQKEAVRTEQLVEKYRPDTIEQMIGQAHVKPKLQEYVSTGNIPHLLFSGSAGLGKTTAAIAITKELYGDDWNEYFLELNASDERGIDVVRQRIKEFARSGYDTEMRIVFLDEADNLTDEAQSALRRTMEKLSSVCRFVLSCNYSAKIIEPIQSRCAVWQFQPVPDDELREHLMWIADMENMELTQSAFKAIVRYADGDVRKAVNALDALYVEGETLTGDGVVTALPIASEEDVLEILQLCESGEFNKALESADYLMRSKGVTARNIIQEIHNVVWDLEADDRLKVAILNEAGNREFYIDQGASPRIQIGALLGTITLEASR